MNREALLILIAAIVVFFFALWRMLELAMQVRELKAICRRLRDALAFATDADKWPKQGRESNFKSLHKEFADLTSTAGKLLNK